MSLSDDKFLWLNANCNPVHIHSRQEDGTEINFDLATGSLVGLRPVNPGASDRWLMRDAETGQTVSVSFNTAAVLLQNGPRYFSSQVGAVEAWDAHRNSMPDVLLNRESSVMAAIAYYPSVQIVLIKFHSGAWWAYQEVPSEVWAALVTADSIGSAYSKHLKGTYDAVTLAHAPQDDALHLPSMGVSVLSITRKDLKGEWELADLLRLP